MARSLAQIPLPCPVDALRQHVAVLGKPGAGKSSKLRVIVEALLDASERVCIIDPKGDWWGLKSSADGSRAGYPILVLGGTHGDMPLPANAGKEVGELVASGAAPAVLIDTSELGVAERERFVMGFFEALFRHMVGALNLVVDECHNFAPQGKMISIEGAKMLRWANRVASEGRGRGINLFSASQRPQKVHKDYLTVHETLIACRVIHPLDKGAIRDWMDGADPKLAKQIDGELAEMPRAEAWVWSPEIKYGPVRTAFPMFRTFDSFSPRTDNKAITAAAVNVDVVRDRLASIVAEKEASDPALLKKRVAELERQVKQQTATETGLRDLLKRQANTILQFEEQEGEGRHPPPDKDAAAIRKAAIEAVERLSKALGLEAAAARGEGQFFPIRSNGRQRAEAIDIPGKLQAGKIPRESIGGKSETKILNALAWWEATGTPGPHTKTQVAFVAGYTAGAGRFGNLLGALKSAGKIDYPQAGTIALTAAGRAEAEIPTTPTTTAALHEMVLAKLDPSQRKIMAHVLEAGRIEKTHLALDTGYTAGAGRFGNLIGSLRSLGLIDYPSSGVVEAEPFLFLGRK